jgi:hypothetical protein
MYGAHLMEEMVERGNIRATLRQVQANQGSPGGDDMRVDELPEFLKTHGRVREACGKFGLSQNAAGADMCADRRRHPHGAGRVVSRALPPWPASTRRPAPAQSHPRPQAVCQRPPQARGAPMSAGRRAAARGGSPPMPRHPACSSPAAAAGMSLPRATSAREGVSDLLIWYPLLEDECYQLCMEVP